MNIDTLKRKDGTYRSASVSDIKRMLSAGHVTHIQTARGTIAIRPGTRARAIPAGFVVVIKGIPDRGWTVDRAVAGITDRSQSKWFKVGEQVRLMRCVIRFLNGTMHSFEAGDSTTVEANQGERDAHVLAVLGEQVLVEYEMPAGTTALVLFAACGNMLTRIKTIPHNQLSQSWIDAIHDQGWGCLWVGMGQRMHEAMPLPAHS
jgi:hypothetical protein